MRPVFQHSVQRRHLLAPCPRRQPKMHAHHFDIGFVKMRRRAQKNWEERRAYEELVRMRTAEKRAARLAREGLEGGGAAGAMA